MAWGLEVLEAVKDLHWVKLHLEEALGILVHCIASKMYLGGKKERELIRRAFESFFDLLYDTKEEKRKEYEHLLIVSIKNLFLLINQLEPQGKIFFYPLLCEYLVTDVIPEEIQKLFLMGILEDLPNNLPQERVKGILYTLDYLRGSLLVLPKFSSSFLESLESKRIECLLYMQLAFPDLKHLFEHMGFPKEKLNLAKKSQSSLLNKKESARSIQGPLEQTNQEETEEETFKVLLKDALKKRILGELDKEKTSEITQTVLYYQRVAIGSRLSQRKISNSLLKYCISWLPEGKELKKSFDMYLTKSLETSPAFVSIYMAYSLFYDKTEKQEVLLPLAEILFADDPYLFLDSLLFFFSHIRSQVQKESAFLILQHFLILTKEKDLQILAQLLKAYPWLSEELQAFSGSSLLEPASLIGPQTINSPENALKTYKSIAIDDSISIEYIESALAKLTKKTNPNTKASFSQILSSTSLETIQKKIKISLERELSEKNIHSYLSLLYFSLLLEFPLKSLEIDQ
ncbi:hypothetical protein NEFER03_1407 [Nematocida sp. LUAm3]|nr:hypothetical protein NEFER03_1407 [Nematocida sp. LUAm3]KAI5174763.1 hypothetical protein NEFER02_0873 [Nematocida sp. LUAm2]KAI5177826.1 hypothetical protein NEFER01_1028 [Nematocida sp. LUAm1]